MENNKILTISVAGNRKATNWMPQTMYWSHFTEKLRQPIQSTETLDDYLKLPKSQQDELKDVGGFVGGELIGRRTNQNLQGRDLLTLDLDNIPPNGTHDILLRLQSLHCAYVVYSTRKHEPARPRLRVIFPADRTISIEEYEPVLRKVAIFIGIEFCDPSTFEPSRLMYWPSCCKDSQYIFHYADAPFISIDGILSMYTDWQDITSWPQVPGAEKLFRRMATKQGEPTTKKGTVGAFCRVFDVPAAIARYLSDVYTPCVGDRYTYTGGSTAAGAVLYDNGSFLFSHHATDPAGGRLCNAFDLVRIHRFAHMDEEAKPDTPVNKLPSFLAMCECAIEDKMVATEVTKARYTSALDDFGDSDLAAIVQEDKSWMAKLEVQPRTGLPLKTMDNALIILENDPLIKGKLYYDEFSNQWIVNGALPWNRLPEKRIWTDVDDVGFFHHLEHIHDLNLAEKKSYNALTLYAHKNKVNSVKDYLTGLVWDGMERLDRLFIDYLGAPDTAYTRTVTRKSFCAAVARAMRPGVKYDYMPIIVGPQGIGKSTLLRIMGQEWFSDNLESFTGKDASLALQGIWLLEVGELKNMNKTDINTVKQFISRQIDIFREPYGKRTSNFPRRCVFFGTTNQAEFLRDETGNRRFWPVESGRSVPIKSVFQELAGEVSQLWAEAVARWQAGEALYLSKEMEAEAERQRQPHIEIDPLQGQIESFLEREIPVGWFDWDINRRKMYLTGLNQGGIIPTMPRDRICALEIWHECLSMTGNMPKYEAVRINSILQTLEGWERKNSIRFGSIYGRQRGFARQQTS